MEMEDLELEELDIGSSILSRFSTSSDEDHRHLCTTVGAMAQELKDNNVSLTPIAYLGATVSSLDRIFPSASGPDHSLGALICFLELVMPRVSIGIRRKKGKQLMEILVRVLRGSRLSSNAIASGVNCVSSLLVTRDSGCCWDDVAQVYAFVLGFITDSDPKVRRQSHECIRDVLESFQRTPLIGPASESLTNLFQRLLLLAGEAQGVPSESGAQEILHVLEALKDCLPYISMKYKTVILKYYKTLLERVPKPPVTRRVTDSLNVLCLHQSQEVSAEVLADLLGLLAKSVAREETSADGLTFIARLLDVGMRKVHSLNKQICIDNLPAVLNALQDIFGSGFQEPKFAATEAMKSLLQTCVDEELIKLGTDRIKNSSFLSVKKSTPSIIERICATIGSLIDNSYRNEWDMSFQVLSVMFHKLGKSSSVLLRGSLESMASIANEGAEGFSEIKQLQECMGSALQSIGPEVFLSIVPLNLKADNLSEVNDWLFPILKHYTIGARLRFYVESLMDVIGYLKDKSHKLKLEGRVQSSRVVDTLVYHVWSLLPSFCNYPVDTNESFNLLEQVLCNAISEEPDLHGIISSSLQILIQQNKSVIEGSNYGLNDKTNVSTERAISYYNHEVASANLSVLKSSARNFMSVISKVFLKSTNDPGGSLLITIGEFASIANKDVVSRFFKTTMHKLLKVTKDARGSEKSKNSMQIDNSSNDNSLSHARAHFFDLAVSLLPGLGTEEIDLLFVAIVPALKDDDGLVQKKAYKVLSVILKNSDDCISRKLEELLKLMIEVLPLCHFSAKRHRLDCLYYLIVHAAKDNAEQKKVAIISAFLTEIVLALKEANKKTRNRAYDVLVQIGHARGDEDKGGNTDNLLQFFNMVAAGLAGEEPHMISAAVKGLARLAYEFSDLVSTAYNILPSTFLLLKRKNREIIKANLGLMKVLVAKSPADNLQNYLSVMVEGLLSWQDEKKNYFKAKVKHLLEMLIKKCGLDAVKAVMPEEHMKLLTNIRKIKERKDRKLAAHSETRSYRSKATTSRQSEWGHTKVFSDFDDETSNGDYMDAETAGGRRSSKFKSKASSIRSRKTSRSSEDMIHHLEDEPLDLLDQRKTRLALRSGGKRKFDSDDEAEFDEEGRLIVHEGEKSRRDNKNKSSEYESDEERDKIEVGSHVSRNSSKKAQKRQKTSESSFAYTGKEYRSKKARGDVKLKGKLEPYAYYPLDRKMLSRRPGHKAAAKRGMASVVKLTKKMEGRSVASALSLKSKKYKKGKSNK